MAVDILDLQSKGYVFSSQLQYYMLILL